jgi:hypothetical protein
LFRESGGADAVCPAFYTNKKPSLKMMLRLVIISGFLSLLGGFGVPGVSGHASAAANGAWVDQSTIAVGNKTYFDSKSGDSLEYKLQGGSGCDAKNVIDGFNGSNPPISSVGTATLHTYAPASDTDSRCKETKQKITLSDTGNFAKIAVWQDAGTIVSSDRQLTFKKDANGSFYTSGTCKNKITPDGSQTSGQAVISYDFGGKCNTSKPYTVQIANPTVTDPNDSTKTVPASSINAGTADTTTPGGGTAAKSQDNASCELSRSPLTWILCPIFNAVADMSDWLFSHLVQPLLRTSPVSTDPSDTSYKIWSSFRIYGDIFLVIGLLVIVFGQAIGGGLVDAYTAKKVLPRLLLAAVLINLSIYIIAFMVDLTNIVGGGLGQLITQPLDNAGAFKITPSGVQQGEIVGGGALIAKFLGKRVFASLFSLEAGNFIMLFIVLPTVLGLLAAFLTLIVRKALLLALLIISPVAFALYCLPNTEKYFRKWWDLLLKTLLVYPIVIMFFAIADVLSVTFPQANNSNDPLPLIISFLLQFLPLVFIPYAFKLAGGAIGQLHETFGGLRKRGVEAIKGNANDQNSLRNRTKRNLGETITRAQSQDMVAGDRIGASRGDRLRGRMSGSMGNVNQRLSTYNKLAQDRRDQLMATGDDGDVYSGGGYKISAGEAIDPEMAGALNFQKNPKKAEDSGMGAASYDRFFTSKGDEISDIAYNRGQRFQGATRSAKGSSLGYNLQKGINDKQRKNFRFSMGRNAKADNWDQAELDGTHAQATFPHKGTNATEWYSKPKVVKDAKGRTTGIRYEDVNKKRKNYSAMMEDVHLSREGFKISQDRDGDMRAMLEEQRKLEKGFDTGKIQDMDDDGNMYERDFNGTDLRDLARTYETFDAITSKMQTVDPSGGDPSVVSTSGTPAAQAIIKDAMKRQHKMTATGDGVVQITSAAGGAASVKTKGEIDRDAFIGG